MFNKLKEFFSFESKPLNINEPVENITNMNELINEEENIQPLQQLQPPIEKNQTKYNYIEDDQFSRSFYFSPIPKNTIVHFCLYSINTNCFIEGNLEGEQRDNGSEESNKLQIYNETYPFLQFIFQKKDENYTFPTMDYEIPYISEKEQESTNEKLPEQIHFENECYKYVFSLLKEESNIHNGNIDFSKLYKGYIIHDENNIFVLFDLSSLIQNIKQQYTIGIIDEIINKKQIYLTPIHQYIIDFFNNNDYLQSIKNIEGHKYPYPLQLYMTRKIEGEYLNDKVNSKSLFLPFEHDLISMAFCFTKMPIIESNIESFQRFACFIVNSFTIPLDISSEISNEEKNEMNEKILYASTIHFNESGLEITGIKNILQFTNY